MEQLMFPLQYTIQNYAWGKPGAQSLVYKLWKASEQKTVDPEDQKPYAELWMGDHPNGPSQIIHENDKLESVKEHIEKNPEFFLGEAFNGREKRLPFLFKVLSVNSVLSLQVHPNKKSAAELHKLDPNTFRDDNHKPEIVIALSQFEAFCNFRPYAEILEVLEESKDIGDIVGSELVVKFKSATTEEASEVLRLILYEILLKDKTMIKDRIDKLIAVISEKEVKTERDRLVLDIHKQYPEDSGIFISYFLNHITLNPGESFIMHPEEPHSYIKGDCIECMAGSDNVIRACFTPKKVDKELLCRIINTKMSHKEVMTGDKLATFDKEGYSLLKYPTPYTEFTCYSLEMRSNVDKNHEFNFKYPSIALVIKGDGVVSIKNSKDKESETFNIREGQSFLFVPNTYYLFESLEGGLHVYICTSQSLSLN